MTIMVPFLLDQSCLSEKDVNRLFLTFSYQHSFSRKFHQLTLTSIQEREVKTDEIKIHFTVYVYIVNHSTAKQQHSRNSTRKGCVKGRANAESFAILIRQNVVPLFSLVQ